MRARCRECHGSAFCEHDIRSDTCQICKPLDWLANLLRNAARSAITRGGDVKDRPTLDYYGVETFQELKDFLQLKMDHHNRKWPLKDKISFDNFALDHIRPIAEFNRCDVAADSALAYHFTNLQPLLPPDNAFKSDKWNSECEDYWRAHIIHKPDYHEIFNPFQETQ